MRPKSEPKQVERALFQSELEPIIDLRDPLVRLAQVRHAWGEIAGFDAGF